MTESVFQAEMWRRVGRTDRRTNRRTDASPPTAVVFFSSYKLSKTVTVTMLLMFGPVMLLCGTSLCIKLSEGPVQSSDCQTNTPSLPLLVYLFTLVRFTNNTALILPPDADQRRSEISSLAASETFTQRRRRRIGARSPHANGSVNGATGTCIGI